MFGGNSSSPPQIQGLSGPRTLHPENAAGLIQARTVLRVLSLEQSLEAFARKGSIKQWGCLLTSELIRRQGSCPNLFHWSLRQPCWDGVGREAMKSRDADWTVEIHTSSPMTHTKLYLSLLTQYMHNQVLTRCTTCTLTSLELHLEG